MKDKKVVSINEPKASSVANAVSGGAKPTSRWCLYCFEFPELDRVKVGITTNVLRRQKELSKLSPIGESWSTVIGDKESARLVERLCHSFLSEVAEFERRYEYFDCAFEEAKKVCISISKE